MTPTHLYLGEVRLVMEKFEAGKGNHAGSQSDIPDIDQLIEANPCHKLYMELEECLVTTDRSWSKCQQQVRPQERQRAVISFIRYFIGQKFEEM